MKKCGAQATTWGRPAASSYLPDAFAADPDRLARFQREAQVLASLNHPGIAAIYGIEKSEDTQALVLELVEGPTLLDRIAKGPIPLDEALPIAKQIAEALEAAHEAGVIHRDLKPANIKVREDGTVKVLDFGLAKALDTTPQGDPSQSPTLTAAATQMGVILGTAAYMSPEQARGKTVDKRADVWAFGAVLYDMLTGTRAFDGEDVTQTLARVVERDPNWERLPAGAPPVLTALLRACLTKDPKHRLRDVGEFRLAIEGGFDIVQHQTPQAGPASRSPFWRHPALGWGAAAAVATGMLVLRTASVPVDDTLDGVTRQSAILLPEGVDWPVIGSGIAVSPDGRSLVFELWRNGVSQLYRRPIDRLGDPEPIPDTERAIAPFFAPDGQSLAYFRGLCLADELLARRSLEGLGNGWARTPEQRGKEFGEVDESLSCGADDAGEDLLGLRAAGRPIAATDFAIDDGRADGLLGTPVGRVHLGRPQEGEHGGEFAVEMGGEALGGRQGGRRVEEPPEAREQAPTGHGEAVIGERVCRPSVAEREGVGEDRLHAGRPRTVRMIRGQRACPS